MNKIAKALIGIALLGLIAFVLTGCNGAPNKEFTEGLRYGFIETGLRDEYKAYIKADPNISDETKKIRTETADRLSATIEKAYKKAREE